jgi:hypothetical protein
MRAKRAQYHSGGKIMSHVAKHRPPSFRSNFLERFRKLVKRVS